MEFKNKKLPNGLVIIGEINKSAKSGAVGFFVRTGSRDESPEINGVSHFLEHMLFKGTENLNAAQVNTEFDKRGAQFNASTSEEATVYYAAVLPDFVIDIAGLWGHLMEPALRDEDFSMEKNVIKQEIAMYKDIPSFDVMDRCRGLYFDGHPCGNSVLGTVESIEKLSSGQMRDYFINHYAPNHIVVACTGNVDWARLCEKIEELCGRRPPRHAERALELCRGSGKKKRLTGDNFMREHICLMSAGVPAKDPRRFACTLLACIIGDSVGSRFFWQLVDKALAETAVMYFSPMDGTGAFASYISCSSENADRVLDITSRIFDDIYKNGVSRAELDKARNKILSALVIKNEVPMGRLLDVGLNWMYLEQYRSVQADIEALNRVTIEEIHSIIQKFNPGDFTQFSLGPSAPL